MYGINYLGGLIIMENTVLFKLRRTVIVMRLVSCKSNKREGLGKLFIAFIFLNDLNDRHLPLVISHCI